MMLPTTHIRTAPPRAAEDRRLKLIGLLVIAGSFGAFGVAVNELTDKWSLGLLYVFPFVVLAVISSNLFAAGMILVAVGCGSGRTLRDPRRRRAVILQVLLANALVLAGLAGALMDDKSLQAHFADSGWDIALAVAAYVFCFIAWRLWRRSRQHDSLSADEAMALDPRPPVLYLRSFQDDGVSMFAEASTLARRLLKALSLPTSEEYTATILARIGPLIAIGKPDEPLPELGAARLYVAHDQWQRKVTELMQRAALVVVRVGASPGVLWEIEQALSMLPRQRLVLTVLGGTAVAPELVTRLTPILGTTLAAVWPEPHLGWRTLVSLRTSRRIGGLVCFNADGKASAVPVQMGIAGSNQWSWLRMNFFRAPLELAWKDVFVRSGLNWGDPRNAHSRAVAVLLALLLGCFGAHWFYLGNKRRAWKYVAMLPLMMAPLWMSWVDAIRFIWAERAEFESRHLASPAL